MQKRNVSSISIVVESGIIYSLGVMIYLILGAIPSTAVVQNPVVEMLAQVVGIVPTLIIVRVGLGVSVQSIEGTVSAAKSQADDVRLPPKRHVLRIGRPVPVEDYDWEKGTPPSYHYKKNSAPAYSNGNGIKQGSFSPQSRPQLYTSTGQVVYSVERLS